MSGCDSITIPFYTSPVSALPPLFGGSGPARFSVWLRSENRDGPIRDLSSGFCRCVLAAASWPKGTGASLPELTGRELGRRLDEFFHGVDEPTPANLGGLIVERYLPKAAR